MKRYPPYDPPEYLDWKPHDDVIDAYRQRFEEDAGMRRTLESLGEEGIGRLYRGLVRNRLHDVTLKRWVRTGVLSKAWLGTGEEAVTVGATLALEDADVVGPMIRNAAASFERGISLEDCLKAYLGTGDTITRGRDLHIGDLRHGVVAPISHVGDLVPVLAGHALAFAIRGEERVALTWVGDGATRTGAFHEGLSMAAARSLPLIVIVQDNGVALGTKRESRFAESLRRTAGGYAVAGLESDGNHLIEVYHVTRTARRMCVEGQGPVVIYTQTFRMGGHATHDEAEGRALFPAEEFEAWGRRDPVGCFEEWLVRDKVISNAETLLSEWEETVTREVEEAAERALAAQHDHPPDPAQMAGDVIAGIGE